VDLTDAALGSDRKPLTAIPSSGRECDPALAADHALMEVQMRKILIAIVPIVAFAGSANAAAKHTWFNVNYADRTCELSRATPEQFALIAGRQGNVCRPDWPG
jgi:hypothetical protein